mmetsp:Transcript_72085/g.167043  ORF Transcript_72085/g.167043 Transcript_72085/m.167043 type:complete len:257 (+) Transcript_72085:990-1760(+)
MPGQNQRQQPRRDQGKQRWQHHLRTSWTWVATAALLLRQSLPMWICLGLTIRQLRSLPAPRQARLRVWIFFWVPPLPALPLQGRPVVTSWALVALAPLQRLPAGVHRWQHLTSWDSCHSSQRQPLRTLCCQQWPRRTRWLQWHPRTLRRSLRAQWCHRCRQKFRRVRRLATHLPWHWRSGACEWRSPNDVMVAIRWARHAKPWLHVPFVQWQELAVRVTLPISWHCRCFLPISWQCHCLPALEHGRALLVCLFQIA